MTFPLYAIREKATGKLFPAQVNAASHFDFHNMPKQTAPRFWLKERDARGFLTTWCKGALTWQYENNDYDGKRYLDFEENTQRNKENYEIVRFTASEVP